MTRVIGGAWVAQLIKSLTLYSVSGHDLSVEGLSLSSSSLLGMESA